MFLKKHASAIWMAFLCLLVCGNCQNGAVPVEAKPDNPPSLPPISKHVRGVWLTNVGSQVLYSPESIKGAVKNCRKKGINHIFVVMWNKGRTLYPSKIMRDSFGIEIEEALQGRDPLREIIDAAHADSIKVYAWMEYGFAAENSGFGEHILRLRPDWAALGQDGKVVVKNGFKWMNALDPRVQNFMINLLKEVVLKYPDLDGIQGDDRLPALPSEAGYNPEIVAAYRAENNGQEPSHPKNDANWVNWRAARLNQFAERIYKELKVIRPGLKIAMAPSIYPFSKTEYLQDWPTWVQQGWVDLISPQIYRYDLTAYSNELSKMISGQISADKLHLLAPGVLLKIGNYLPTEDFLKLMVKENRLRKINGEVFFFYEGLNPHSAYFDQYARE